MTSVRLADRRAERLSWGICVERWGWKTKKGWTGEGFCKEITVFDCN